MLYRRKCAKWMTPDHLDWYDKLRLRHKFLYWYGGKRNRMECGILSGPSRFWWLLRFVPNGILCTLLHAHYAVPWENNQWRGTDYYHCERCGASLSRQQFERRSNYKKSVDKNEPV